LPEIIRTSPATLESSLKNIELAVTELAQINPHYVISLTPENIYNNEDCMFKFLETIKKSFNHDIKPKKGEKNLNYKRNNITTHSAATKIQSLNRENLPPKKSLVMEKMSIPRDITVVVEQISNKTKEKIMNWLREERVIKNGAVSIKNFPEYCRSGVLIADLIVRMERIKHKILGGIIKKPKNATEAISNVRMCLKYLQKYEKMNARYLWSEKQIVNGNTELIWGLLDDIYCLFNKGKYCLIARSSSIGKNNLPLKSVNINQQSLYSNYSPRKPSLKYTDKLECSRSKRISFSEVTSEVEAQTRGWLKSLNLTVLPLQECGSLLLNPYRNGVLLCELFELLEPVKIHSKTFNPSTLLQAQINIEAALINFQRKHPKELPENFCNEETVQEILKGNRIHVWGVLTSIRLLYPQFDRCRSSYLHLESTELPFTTINLREIEANILDWLKRVGALGLAHRYTSEPMTLLEIEDEIRDGTILCKLAEIMSNKIIKGTFKEPKSEATCTVNIRKAFECFRGLPKISHKHLWLEKEVLKGNKERIFSLLETLRQYHEEHCKDLYLGVQCLEPTRVKDLLPTETMRRNRPNNSVQFKRDNSSIKNDIESIRLDTNSKRSFKLPSSKSMMRNSFPATRYADIYPKSILELSKVKTSIWSNNLLNENYSVTIPEEEQYKLIDWLEMIGVKLPEHFSLSGNTLEAFKDGVLLCQIVGILEKKNIEGIVANPKTTASAKHNIKKALDTLYKNSEIPLTYLEAIDEIYNGDYDTIINLLKLLTRVYKTHWIHLEQHKNTMKLRSRILSSFNSTLCLKNVKAPFGTIDASCINDTEPLNNSLSKADRKRFLIAPGKAWN